MKYSLFISLFLLCFNGIAQYDINDVEKDSTQKDKNVDPFELKKRIYVGGDFSLRFGTQTYLYLSPLVGYDITKTFSGGFTTMYQLYRIKYSNSTVVSESSYGGGIFLRYKPFNFLVLHTEFDLYNTRDYTVTLGGRINVPALMLGAGYAGSMGGRSYYNIMLLYDFIQDPNMPLPRIFNPAFYLKYGFVFYLEN